MIPKGVFDTIEYSSDEKSFIIRRYDSENTIIKVNATQEELDIRGIIVPLDSFLNGIINEPISIPNTYKKLEGKNTNGLDIFSIFSFPIKGLIESSDIIFLLLITGGALNLLIEMDVLNSGMKALTRYFKGKDFLLLILILILVAIGGTTFGFLEEVLSFYPILMPIFLENKKFDAILSMTPLYLGAICGNMFSTINAYSVVIASYAAGIDFIEGIYLRVGGLILSIIITIIYLYLYLYIQQDEKRSFTYEYKDEILRRFGIFKYIKQEEEDILEGENNAETGKFLKKKEDDEEENINEIDKNTNNDNHDINEKKEDENIILVKKSENEDKISENNIEKEKITLRQWIYLIIFFLGIISIIPGVAFAEWTIVQMATVFFVLAIIFIFLFNRKDKLAIEAFLEGAGGFCGVGMIIGIARGINLILQEGKVSGTILNWMLTLVEGQPKFSFGIEVFLLNIVFGALIQTSSGLAILLMPAFAPLADEVNCSREVVVNAYMLGQALIGIITPTGIIFMILELVGIKYLNWLKFISIYMVFFFVFSLIFISVNIFMTSN